MELALNLAWFIVALSSYILLIRYLASPGTEPARGPSRWPCVLALSFALAILFPVISLTDDLHEMQATVEEPSSSRIVLKVRGVSHPLTLMRALYQLSSYIVSSSWTGVGWVAFGNIAAQRTARPLPGLSLTMSGRSPPSFVVTQIN